MKYLWAIFFPLILVASDPKALYLSILRDPAHAMAIQWLTPKKTKESLIFYQKEGQETWAVAEGITVPLPRGETSIHRVHLEDLEADAVYYFRIGPGEKTYKFRTCPESLTRPLTFIDGGDAYFHLSLFRRMNKEIVKTDPDFVVIGGDIAYVHGHRGIFKWHNWKVRRWTSFFEKWTREMVAPDGRLIPMVIVVGNHDVKHKQIDPLFYSFFAFPTKNVPYYVLDFGRYLSLFLLDSGHTYPIAGKQSVWLEERLAERGQVPLKIASYHVAAYPSVYPYEKEASVVRENWVPLFEKHGVQVAFEHHNHAFKRTHLLKEGKIDPEGVLYLGDGAWGVTPRRPSFPRPWYLARSAQKNCVWHVTLEEEKYLFEALDENGRIFDEVIYTPIVELTR